MSKQVLRRVAELAMLDYLASGRVVTKCAAGRRCNGSRVASGKASKMSTAMILGIILR